MYYLTIYDVMLELELDYRTAYFLLTTSNCPTKSNQFELFVEGGKGPLLERAMRDCGFCLSKSAHWVGTTKGEKGEYQKRQKEEKQKKWLSVFGEELKRLKKRVGAESMSKLISID